MQARRQKCQKRKPITEMNESALAAIHGGEAPNALETTTIGAD